MNQDNTSYTTAWSFDGKKSALSMIIKPLPSLKEDEVLIENHAIGINPVDWKVIDNGSLAEKQIAGVDGAGIIKKVGSEKLNHLLSKRVAYHQDLSKDGSFAHCTILNASALMPIPEGLDFSTAASLPCPLMTAWQAVEKIPSHPGKQVLVNGASGSVGRYLIQLLMNKGFVVSAIASKKRHTELKELGVNNLYPDLDSLNYENFYAAFDTKSVSSAEKTSTKVKANGHLIPIQGRIEQPPFPAFGKCISLHEIALGALHKHGTKEDWMQLTLAASQLMELIKLEKFTPNHFITFPFSTLDKTLEEFKSDRKALKYVVTI